MIYVDVLFQGYQRKQGTPHVMGLATAIPSRGAILLIVVLVLLPITHEEVVALIGKFESNLVKVVAIQALVDQVIGGSPDVPRQ